MRECRTVRYGGRVVLCPTCGLIKTIYNPCNQRGCPICYKRNQKIWKNRVVKALLNVPHYHLVFSIPQAFTAVWLRHKKDFMNAFFACVKRSIATITSDYGVTPGCVAVFQTHGSGMSYKPHVHCALTAGGINKKNEWVARGSISYRKLAKVIQENLVKELKKRGIEDLPQEHTVNNREWSVYATYYKDGAKQIIGYLSHTAHGVVINLNQTIEEDHKNGTIRFTEMHAGKLIHTVLEKTIFIKRYLNHIPPPHTVTVRYYGVCSNKYRELLEELKKQFPIEIEYEDEQVVDYCPHCHTPMEILMTFDPYEIVMTYEEYCERGPPEGNVAYTVLGPILN